MSPSGSRTEEFLERKHSVEFLRIFFYFVSTSKLYVVNANSVMVLIWCRWPVTSHLVWGFKSCFCSKFWIDSSTNHIWRAEEKLIFIGCTNYFLTEFVWTRKKPYKEIFTWPCHLILRSRFSKKRSSKIFRQIFNWFFFLEKKNPKKHVLVLGCRFA